MPARLAILLVLLGSVPAAAAVDGADLRAEAEALVALGPRTPGTPGSTAILARLTQAFRHDGVAVAPVEALRGVLARVDGSDESLRKEAVLVIARVSGPVEPLAMLPTVLRLAAAGGRRTTLVLATTADGSTDLLGATIAHAGLPVVAMVEIEALEGASGRPGARCDASPGLQRTLLRARRDSGIFLWLVSGGRPREEPAPVEGVVVRALGDHAIASRGGSSDASLGRVADFVVEIVRTLAAGEEVPLLGRATAPDRAPGTGLLAQAERLAADRKFIEALGLAARALGENPEAAEARLFRAGVLLELNRPEAARAEAEEVLRVNPDDPGARLIRGRAAEAVGDETSAIADYEGVLKLQPDSTEALARRGTLLVRWRRLDEGRADIEKALARVADHPVALKGRGMAFFYEGKIPQAFVAFDKVVRRAPEDWEGWFYRGLVRTHDDGTGRARPMSVNDLRRGVSDLTSAVTADPRQPLPFAYRGDLHLLLGEYALARADFDRALALGPATAHLHFQRGLAALSLDDFDPAIEDFVRVTALDPGESAAPYNIACAHARAGRDEAAIVWLGRAVAAGFLDRVGNGEHMRTDPDLRSLRRRPDFQRLLRANRAD